MSDLPVRSPLVSVILPVRDRAACVGRAIRSVHAQSYPNIELIVVDDGSCDETAKVVEEFGTAAKLIRQQSRGAYGARNAGIAEATGTLIAFIDSDDAWYPDKLARQVPLFEDQGVGLAFGDVRHVRSPEIDAEATGTTSFMVAPPPRGDAAAAFAYRNFVPTSAAVVRRSCMEEIGGFAPDARLSADYLAWFQIALRHRFAFVEDCVADYTVHPAGISHDLVRSLDARLLLFGRALEGTTDGRAHTLIRRLRFNLAVSLLIAVLRRRTPGGGRWQATAALPVRIGGADTPLWLAAFLRFQASRRLKRFIAWLTRGPRVLASGTRPPGTDPSRQSI